MVSYTGAMESTQHAALLPNWAGARVVFATNFASTTLSAVMRLVGLLLGTLGKRVRGMSQDGGATLKQQLASDWPHSHAAQTGG